MALAPCTGLAPRFPSTSFSLSDRLPARLAAYTFWSLLLLLLMLLGAVALAVAVAFAFAVAVAVTDTFRMGGDHESYKAL